jgi:hypothetical protein
MGVRVNTALDETGATLGPLLITFPLPTRQLSTWLHRVVDLLAAGADSAPRSPAWFFRSRHDWRRKAVGPHARGFTRAYWLYMLAAAFFGAGLMSFEFVSYHLSTQGTVTEHWIPLFLAISTGMGVIARLVLGRLYDRIGLPVVLIGVILCSLFSPLVFLGRFTAALGGLLLWGIGYATETPSSRPSSPACCRKADVISRSACSTRGYGAGWLAGSTTTGLLYEHSVPAVIGFSIVVQLASLPLCIAASECVDAKARAISSFISHGPSTSAERDPCHIPEPYPVPPLETGGVMKRMFTISLAAVAGAALFGGLVYAVLVVAHVSEPAATTVYGLTLRRLWATAAAAVELLWPAPPVVSARHPGASEPSWL